ncbi:MAG: hypothetical protein J4428_01335 [Candidatus Aenigmarchaeota archaeon]|nr:hypothetical protein [Candidatus Aenigmarchaeota archaeon]
MVYIQFQIPNDIIDLEFGYRLFVYKSADGYIGNIIDRNGKPVAVSRVASLDVTIKYGKQYFEYKVKPRCLFDLCIKSRQSSYSPT